jgi:hypothetical protein
MSEGEQKRLLAQLPKGNNELGVMISTVDVEKSEAFKPEDRENIFASIRETVGVFDAIRDWQMELADRLINTTNDLTTIASLALLYKSQGRFLESERLYVRRVQLCC